MSTAARAQALIDAGYRPVPVNGKQLAYSGDTPEREYNPAHFQDGMRIQVRAGQQPDGVNLYGFDLEGPSHGPQYNAHRELAALRAALPRIADKLRIVPSTNGDGRWLLFRSHKTLHSSQLFDGTRKIGDFIGIGGTQRVPDPGDEPLAILTLTEIELLQAFWAFNHSVGADTARHWTDRAAEGKRIIAGGRRQRVTRPMLRTFLRQCGAVGTRLNSLFDELGGFDRSAEAGNLMQCLMFNAHKLAPNGGYADRCAAAYDYWLAADSYGKAADKDYTQEKDGQALVAFILHEDRKLKGGQWRAPFWAKAHPTPTPQPELEPTPAPAPRAAHRPAGDRDKQIRKLKRILERWQFESAERIYYYVDDLAELLHVKRRAAQNYLEALATDNQIERGQDRGRGGRAWLILLPAFWGADNSEIVPESAKKSPAVWDAQSMPIERIAAPENADRAPQCKGDHQNLCAPISEPGGAAYSPAWCYVPGENWHSPSDPRIRTDKPAPTPRPVAPAQRLPRTRRRVKGQASYLDRRGEQLGKRYQTQPGGQAPEPTRHKPQASTLAPRRRQASPGAPLGAHGSGDLPSAPAGAPPTAAQPSLASNIDVGYIRRLLALGEQEAIERHCRMRGADWQAVVQLAQQVQP